MSLDIKCERCGIIEKYKHLFWKCIESKRVWKAFNDYMTSIRPPHRLSNYEEVFTIDSKK